MTRLIQRVSFAAVLVWVATPVLAEQPWLEFDGGDGPGRGKHIVLVSGDDEYRSEEALPQLAKILSERHGFRCTVLFAVDDRGFIKPDHQTNIPGLEALDSANLAVLFLRFRSLPDEQMEHVVGYVQAGRPIVALRTSTHAFNNSTGPYARWGWQSQEWEGGFGRQVLGETWISHHGEHGKQSTRGLVAPDAKDHPILRGIADGDIWGPTDVYGVRLPLPQNSQPLVLGQVLSGMLPGDEPVTGPQNDPLMPVAWTRSYQLDGGKEGRAFTTTMGASQDLLSEGLRRLLVNACYWGLRMEDQIPPQSDAGLVGKYEPTPFGFEKYTKGLTPQMLK